MSNKFIKANNEHVTPFTKFKFPQGANAYTPSTIELLEKEDAYQTPSGDITWGIVDENDLDTTNIIVPCYAYLATGRFFSTSVAPSEYGDADASDALIVIIYLDDIPSEHLDKLSTGSVVLLTVGMYTNKEAYRIETGNSYADHVEVRAVPMKI